MYNLTLEWPHPGPHMNFKHKIGDCLHLQYDSERWKNLFDHLNTLLPPVRVYIPKNYDSVFLLRDTLVCIPPKCGSTALKQWLFDVAARNSHSQTGLAVWTNIKRRFTPNLTVALIRPYEERFLSGFYDKVWCKSFPKDPFVTSWVIDAFGQSCFDDPNEFALRLYNLNVDQVDQHFRPQHDVCGEHVVTTYAHRLDFRAFVSALGARFNKSLIPYAQPKLRPMLNLAARNAMSEWYKKDLSFAVADR